MKHRIGRVEGEILRELTKILRRKVLCLHYFL